MNQPLYSMKLLINSLPIQFAILWGRSIEEGYAMSSSDMDAERANIMLNHWEFEELLVLFNEWSDEFLLRRTTLEDVYDFCIVEDFFKEKTENLIRLRERFIKEHDVDK